MIVSASLLVPQCVVAITSLRRCENDSDLKDGLSATGDPQIIFAFCSPIMPYCSTGILANSRLLFSQINFSQRLDGTSPVSTVALALRQRRFVFIAREYLVSDEFYAIILMVTQAE